MIKLIIKRIIIFILREFYHDIRIKGDAIINKGPLLIVANHPNHVIDPLIITYIYPQSLWYLAKSTIFGNKIVALILRYFRLLPVYRKIDVGEDTLKNDETFRAVIKELHRLESILIFPEGISKPERKLSKIKTGAARMALQAEALHDFQLGLKIQAVGLTYSNTGNFKSSVTARAAAPIRISDWQHTYQRDPIAAVLELTENIERELRKVTVEVLKDQDQDLVENIAWLYHSAGRLIDDYESYDLIVKNLNLYQNENYLRSSIFERAHQLKILADKMGLTREQLSLPTGSIFKSVLLAPLVFLGIIINFIPYRIVIKVVKYLADNLSNNAVKALVAAIIIFPLWYLLIAIIIYFSSKSLLVAACTLLFMVILGKVTNRYWQAVKIIFLNICSQIGFANYRELIHSRDSLLVELDQLRVI